MAKEQGVTGTPPERPPDKPRFIGSLVNKPRPLASVEDSKEVSGSVPPQSSSGSAPVVLPAASRVNHTGLPPAAAGDSMTDPLRAARQAIDGLLSRTHDIHEEIWRAVESLLADLNGKLRRECDARIAEFEQEIRERGRYQTTALLDQIDIEAESRMAARVDRALERTQEAERLGAQVLTEQAEASRASLTEMTNSAIKELQHREASAILEFHADATKHLNGLEAEHENNLQVLGQKATDSLNERLSKQADIRFQAFQDRLKHLTDETAGQVEIRLQALTEAALTRVTSEVHAAVAREASTYLIEVLHKRLDQLAGSLKE
jgi:hypothetical protein